MTQFDPQRYAVELALARGTGRLNLSWASIFDPAKHPRLAGKFTFSPGTKSVPGHNFYAKPTDPNHPLAKNGHAFGEFHVRQKIGSDLKPKGTYKIVAKKPGNPGGASRRLASGLNHDQLAAKLDKLSTGAGLPKEWRG